MDRQARSKMNTQIYEEACAWFVESCTVSLDEAGRRDFDRWLRKSPEHLSAYLEIAAIWNEGPSMDPDRKWSTDTLIQQALHAGDDNIVPLSGATLPATDTSDGHDAAGGGERLARPAKPTSVFKDARSRRVPSIIAGAWLPRRRWLAAASIAALAILGGILTQLEVFEPTYATARGEQRSIQFADGSTVDLNSRSKIRVKYSARERDIALLEGQALFHVAHDAGRPFIVSVGTARVLAIGTQFDIYKRSSGTVVTVVEGRVAVYSTSPQLPTQSGAAANPQRPFAGDSPPARSLPSGSALPMPRGTSGQAASSFSASATPGALADSPADRSVLLAAGEQLTVTPEASQKTVNNNIAAATAWRERQIVFESASLTEVAEEFNRYNERQLVIDNPQSLTFHVSGVFSSTDPGSIISFLKQRRGVKVTETGSQVHIEREHP